MNNKEMLKQLLSKFRTPLCEGLSAKIPCVNELAEFLSKNGVAVLPEGAIILTKEERAALNEYQKKISEG